MRILFVADGRSPTALNWMHYWVERGDEVHLASTFPCAPGLPLAGLDLVPVAFSAAGTAAGSASRQKTPPGGAALLPLRTFLRHWLGPLTLPRAARRLRSVIDRVRPDLLHAMRIPYEGMLAAVAHRAAPLLISVWGNDFTLHAPSTPLMRYYTRLALRRADALHADCQRDICLAEQWGFSAERPSLVIPGGGGIDTGIFHPAAKPVDEPVIINPRGFRAYVRNDTFFKAIPLILKEYPSARFICPGMAGEAQAEGWLTDLGVRDAVELLPPQPHEQMAGLFRRARVLVSPSTHDGTPNTLLEGIACGCFPVAGDLESIREWITPGVNGLLVDPLDAQALANAVLAALGDPDLRRRAAQENVRIIAVRAEYRHCMAQAEALYYQILSRRG